MESVIKYPSFGQPVGNPTAFKPKHSVALVTKITLIVGVSVGVGALIALPMGAIVGAIVGVALATIIYLGIFIFNKVHKHVQTSILPNVETQPLLGRYIPSDVKVLGKAEEIFQLKKDLISIAETSIEMTPNFAGGEELLQIMDLIDKRMNEKPHLKVHLLISSDFLFPEDNKLFAKLRKKYPARFVAVVSKRIYNAFPCTHTEENHAKMLIVDGKYFNTGGSGLFYKSTESKPSHRKRKETAGLKALPKCLLDTDIFGRGELSHVFRRQFFYLLQKWENRMTGHMEDRFFDIDGCAKGTLASFEGPDLIRGAKTKLIVGAAEHRRRNPITQKIAKRVRKAKKSIKFALMHWMPAKEIRQALKNRDPKVIVELHSNKCDGSIKTASVCGVLNRANYHLIDHAYETDNPDILHHRKLTIYDETHATFGSRNLCPKGDQWDDECMVVVKNDAVAKIASDILESEKAKAIHLTGKLLRKKRRQAAIPAAIFKGLAVNIMV